MTDAQSINVADNSRPLTFSDVVGQVYATGVGQRIGQGIISGQGYILTGPKGCGKTSVARIIARAVNCKNRDPETGDPCNECPSCQLALKGAHYQIEEVNAADKRGVGDMRDLLESMSLSVNSGYRVYILDEVHMLTKEAFSVLLKPMEQPPENVLFIATTTNPEMIPDTIVSRCPIIPINPLEDDDIKKVLHRVIEVNKEEQPLWSEVTEADINHAVRMAQGSARQAITTLSGVIYHGVSQGDAVDVSQEIASSMLDGDTVSVLSSTMEAVRHQDVNPVALVQLLMEELIREIGSADAGRVAKMLASLSQVSRELSSSTPALMASSRIASCVEPIEDVFTQQTCSSDPMRNWLPSEKESHSMKSEKKAEKPRPADETPSSSLLTITAGITLDDIINALFSPEAKKIIPKKWMAVLDNPDTSELYLSDGKLIVEVSHPDSTLREALQKVVSPVVVRSL